MKHPSLFTIYAVLKSIDGSNNHETRLSNIQLRNWKSLKAYLELLLELKWIESFERQESTPYNYVKPTRELRHWKTTWYRLTKPGKEFLELFPQNLALPQAQVEYDDMPSAAEQQANWELFKAGQWNVSEGEP